MTAPDPALVRRVVELLRDAGLVAAPAPRYLTTEEVARRLSVTPRWVREHRALLGGSGSAVTHEVRSGSRRRRSTRP